MEKPPGKMESSMGGERPSDASKTAEEPCSTKQVSESSTQPTTTVSSSSTPTVAVFASAAETDPDGEKIMGTELSLAADKSAKRKHADAADARAPDAFVLMETEIPTKKPKIDVAESQSVTITKVIVDGMNDVFMDKPVDATTPLKVKTSNEDAKQSADDLTGDSALVATRRSSRRLSEDDGGKEDAKADNETTQEAKDEDNEALSGDVVHHYITLAPLTSRPKPLKPLNSSEQAELERVFGIDKGITQWDDDWVGVAALAEEEIANPDAKTGEKTKPKSLLTWAAKGKKSMKILNNLVRQIYNHKKTPEQAKRILGNADPGSFESLRDAIGRLSLDPMVLRQDGWTTAKAANPEGASGGAFRIGEKVVWQGYTGVVIAFVHDPHIGDLWKAMWTEDLSTFDLELEELEDARKKFERRNQAKLQNKERSKDSAVDSRRSNRIMSNADFQVKGIEHGIVLATSYARGARHGVFWPARVMHATELKGSQTKRPNRQKVDVVFMAPYWNSDSLVAAGRRTQSFSDSIATHGDALFRSGPLFEFESIDAHEETIQQYPYSSSTGLDIDELRSSFKFAGLPKAAFARFLDSHRLALALKTFSQNEMKSTAASDIDKTSAGLLEGHPLSALTANFPPEVLHLPFGFILSQLPHPEQDISSLRHHDVNPNEEPPLQLGKILDSMKPPSSWGLGRHSTSSTVAESPIGLANGTPVSFEPMAYGNKDDPYDVNKFLNGLSSLQSLLSGNSTTSTILKNNLSDLLRCAPSSAIHQLQETQQKRRLASSVYQTWVVVKTQGEELVASVKRENTMKEWRRCCERIYKYLCARNRVEGQEAGESFVITDSRCNLHLTSSECFERPVRLPAAMKAVRQAKGNIRVVNLVDDKYIQLAEEKIILKAHKKSYIQRFKKRCFASTQGAIISLTEDSEGNGGEDTKGTKGSWKAAVAAVGAALQGADMIMTGRCVNAFCPTRPPGHHAGRELHAMKAVSNGFCVLNAVACVALYATTPVSEGGLGLSRICVIDIDVHHGNGTQDILCSTYDPRFLYVSIHAGGPHVNGIDLGEIGDELGHHLGRNPKKGIFPGRCGDTSPHEGVLNIPLGPRVTSHALGTALITKVSPAVEKFAPDLIIVSAGFDAHKNDPLNLGGLSAEDFGTLTEIICKLAFKSCSGRVLSVLEGGYGVPCCRPQHFPPAKEVAESDESKAGESKRPPKEESRAVVANAMTSQSLEEGLKNSTAQAATNPETNTSTTPTSSADHPMLALQEQIVPLQCLDLGEDLPPDMPDIISSYVIQKRLDRCHSEGFVQCVQEHVTALARCNVPTNF